MFRKSSKQNKNKYNHKKRTLKLQKKGAGLPGIFKWATSNIMGDTLFGKSIYTVRKQYYNEKPSINTFKTIIMDLRPLCLSEKDKCYSLIDNIFNTAFPDSVIKKINNNEKITKTDFEHVLRLIQEKHNHNYDTKYTDEKISNVIDSQENKTSNTTSTTSSNTEESVSPSTLKQDLFKYFQGMNELPYNYSDIMKVGKGAYGIVYKAIEKTTGQPYALKSIKNVDKEQLEGISNELNILQAVEQNCKKRDDGTMGFIVCFTGITFNKNELYIVNEFLTGYVEMYDFVYKQRRGVVKAEQLPSIIDKICRGLLSIHELGVAHRDIKLENIMINIDNTTPDYLNIKYIDFGFSTKAKPDDGTYEMGTKLNNYKLLGTPVYLDPIYIKANAMRNLNIDILKNSDYYAVGIVCFELICAFKNMSGFTYYTPMDILSINVDDYLNKMTRKEIQDYDRKIDNYNSLVKTSKNKLFTQIIGDSNKITDIAKTNKMYHIDMITLISMIPDRKKGINSPVK